MRAFFRPSGIIMLEICFQSTPSLDIFFFLFILPVFLEIIKRLFSRNSESCRTCPCGAVATLLAAAAQVKILV